MGQVVKADEVLHVKTYIFAAVLHCSQGRGLSICIFDPGIGFPLDNPLIRILKKHFTYIKRPREACIRMFMHLGCFYCFLQC